MNKLITTFKHIFSIEELRSRIINTLLFIAFFRLGSYVALPGVDATKLTQAGEGGLFGLLNIFSGGALSNASVFALGIMPYISASIAIQLLTIALPYFQKMQKDGESGRKKLNQITRILTIFVTAAQAFTYLQVTIPTEAIMVDPWFFRLYGVAILIGGTMLCMWLGEKITDKGIGNGISMLIMIGIVSRFPASILQEAGSRGMSGALMFIIEIIALFFVVMGAIMVTQAVRRIPVQYAKQVVGSKATAVGGERQYIPLKLNASGVMPIIFAQALMFIPGLVAQSFAEKSEFASSVASAFGDFTTWQYNVLFAFLIIVFTFFYTAISINPTQISDDMKRGGGFVPGVKPGEETAGFIATILDRITLPGAVMLSLIAVLPAVANLFGVTRGFASFFGGTSLLILVGVVLDTLQQIESYLLMRKYEGLMQSGRVKGRSELINR
ncbi:preprotein translocase subunit SecY [Aquirufa antheringensis]|jgi:preprotein translocase subunit SecY|uniref:Protein translocase subunit SecY n=1 Tax=Aquirufa antheringensis TaxID=2516559 RepID=A0A4Q9BGP7_9BACT|nr:preprotein translocase subunit SecY [Aquirufa antheringensis]MCE4217736.1 preprotein translocase subunit SecY [Pseudarcicella sp. GAP-15]MCZ2477594.1 preprotein translocase subunit SecY [Aquirufa antheringensis]MCZ2485168.1 preprotein translocase subunit SecY [Aquirufa antheringensis]MCZ2487350.1 preprotein translocase subunit SecY [Aquirufa antheringensis]MCZ2490315.1 preprotein translocase subunit SecY [Aquirufa antheringensis]